MLQSTTKIANKAVFQRALLPFLILTQTSYHSTRAMSTSSSKPAALIFMHGLGDTPAGWSSLERQLPAMQPSLSKLHYVFPAAPEIPITINGGMRMPGWFDLYDWPIGVGVKNDELGLKRSVETIRQCVTDLEKKGIAKSRIVIGGFSQGGAVALRSVYHDDDSTSSEGNGSFAACVNLSGWLTFGESNKVHDDVPLFWGHGSYDDKVLFEQQAHGVNTLAEMGVTDVKHSSYNVGHSSHPEEMAAFAKFLDKILFEEE